MNAEQQTKLARIQQLNRTFTPSAPISRREAFSGRFEQIVKITSAVTQPGRHVVLYGERGVGKTSLSNILSELLLAGAKDRPYAVRVNCTVDDKFDSVWRRVLRQLGVAVPEEFAYRPLSPDDLRMLLMTVNPPQVVVLDEYDRLEDDDCLSLTADTIKSLSDHLSLTKVVLVGVSDSIEDLVGEHESIKRAIEEVQMPRMDDREVVELVLAGFGSLSMEIEDLAIVRIVRLSEGLPSHAHSLCLKAGTHSVQDDRMMVTLGDVEWSTDALVKDRHSSTAAYFKAIQSPRPENLYAQVLAACALAKKDGLGYFPATAVSQPMSSIMGKPYDIPAFARHLSEFLRPERGSILQRKGEQRNYRYRFADPLMQPFSIMAALSSDLIRAQYREELFSPGPDDSIAELVSDLRNAGIGDSVF